ncbi:MAG TPA: TlpA disulfide reductase family protein [Oxalicibacterium sp.]|jgi:thiol-disulfide isomerase/thioredoxin|nr:TlpA disulfide reductase family protein [Oxalicibacterium sp.]
MKSSLSPVLIIAVSFALGGAYVGYKHHSAKPASEAAAATTPKPSPLFEQLLPDAAGIPHKLSQWQGKPLVVNFWATWCAPCVEEMPELSALQAELSTKGAQIIGIGIDTADNIENFAGKYKIAYPLYVAGTNGIELSRQLGNKNGGLPFTVLFDQNGIPVKTYLGRLQMDQLRSDLTKL